MVYWGPQWGWGGGGGWKGKNRGKGKGKGGGSGGGGGGGGDFVTGMNVGILMSGKNKSSGLLKRLGGIFGRGQQKWARGKKKFSSDSSSSDDESSSDEEERKARKKEKKEKRETKKLEKKARRAKMLFDMMNGGSPSGSSSSSSPNAKASDKNALTDGDQQVLKYILGTHYKGLEGCKSWNDLEETIAEMNKSTILKILMHSGIDQKDYKKVERRKTRTSRDDLASTCIENLRSAVHNSKS